MHCTDEYRKQESESFFAPDETNLFGDSGTCTNLQAYCVKDFEKLGIYASFAIFSWI